MQGFVCVCVCYRMVPLYFACKKVSRGVLLKISFDEFICKSNILYSDYNIVIFPIKQCKNAEMANNFSQFIYV